MAFVIAIPSADIGDINDVTTWDLTQAIKGNVPDGGGTLPGLANDTPYRLARLSELSNEVTPSLDSAAPFGQLVQSDFAETGQTAVSEISLQFASAPTPGSLLVIVGSKDKDQIGITPPAGFTVHTNVAPGDGACAFVAYKIADGSETGPLTITTTSSQYGSFSALEISGSFAANPFNAQSVDHDTSTTRNTASVPPLTTTASESLLIGYATNDSARNQPFTITSSNPVPDEALLPLHGDGSDAVVNAGNPALAVMLAVVGPGTYDFAVSHTETDQTMIGLIEVVPAA